MLKLSKKLNHFFYFFKIILLGVTIYTSSLSIKISINLCELNISLLYEVNNDKRHLYFSHNKLSFLKSGGKTSNK